MQLKLSIMFDFIYENGNDNIHNIAKLLPAASNMTLNCFWN